MKRPFVRRRHGLPTAAGGLLGLVALAARAALPFAHDWQVARAEAAHSHALSPGPAPVLHPEPEGSEPHRHHDPHTCSVCPCLSRSRLWVPSTCPPGLTPPPRALPRASALPPPPLGRLACPAFPRGPPGA